MLNNEPDSSCTQNSVVHGRLTAKRPRWLQAIIQRSISMIIFNVPYAPLRLRAWSVGVSRQDHSEFDTRQDAVRFAVSSARTSENEGKAALVAIEGVDGLWRLFDHYAKGIV